MNSFNPVANITLVQALYPVDENEGFVLVCVMLTAGVLERSITGLLNTTDQTAFGKNIVYSLTDVCVVCIVCV